MQVSLPSALVVASVVVVLGVLAYLQIPGAAVAALGAAGAIATWVTQGPTKASTGQSLFPPANDNDGTGGSK